MADSTQDKSQFSFRLDPELRRKFNSKAKERGEFGTELLVGFIRSYLSDAPVEPQPIDCPLCGSLLQVVGKKTEIVEAGSDPQTITVPHELRDILAEFIKFATAPAIEDKGWSEALLKEFRSRIASQNSPKL